MAYETAKSRVVTAVLGPTNTGKTHLAIERMLDHDSGMIGLPLRLLAREIYDKIVGRVGEDKVALITGEEKIKPDGARYWVSTVEAMPREIDVDFLAIDEVQLAADLERGHTFTDRLLNARGQLETLMLGAGTMRDVISDLVPGANFIARPRLSKLTYSGQKKITRLPARSAVIAFSASEVYAIAELIRRQRGGAAVVLGALSPRTRNAQVALYQSGDVDYLVATDAVGMGLNLDVDHVAFSAIRKFDGQNFRNLTPAEIGQIAGRAGRHANDGTFGVTGDVEPFDNDLVDRLETHTFDKVRMLQWRSTDLDFASLDGLRGSLRQAPSQQGLIRARDADDVIALDALCLDRDIAARAGTPRTISLLWDTCQVPDYRKVSPQSHAELVAKIYRDLTGSGQVIDEDWFARQVAFSDKTDGDIDTLANRIAHIRTWTFISNRPDWLKDPAHWQERTREIENNLSDALHACLTQRFVDQRTSALMKGLRLKDELNAEIGEDGAINVENHFVGRLVGFRFIPESRTGDVHGKATRSAAEHVLAKELAMRARRVSAAKNDAFAFSPSGRVLWRDSEIGQLQVGNGALKPQVAVLCDENLQTPDREKVQQRLEAFVTDTIAERLKPLIELEKAEDVSGLARGIAFRLCESFGFLRRELVAQDVKSLDQPARAQLRKYGVRFGAFNIFFPLLLKPAPTELLRVLWLLKEGSELGIDAESPPEPPRAGLTSVPVDPALPDAYYRVSGYQICGPRAVRIDILERLADQIRAALAYRGGASDGDKGGKAPPPGATGDGAFMVSSDMMSILGCSAEEVGEVLRALGFQSEKRAKPAPSPTEEKANVSPEASADGLTDAATTEAPATVSEASRTEQEPGTVEAVSEADESSLSPVSKPEQASLEASDAAAEPAGEPGPAEASDVEARDEPSVHAPVTVDAPSPIAVENAPESEPGGVATPAVAGPDDADTPQAASSETEVAREATTASATVSPVAEGEAAESTSDEDAFILVWRPRRRQEPGERRRRRLQRGRGRGAQGDAGAQGRDGASAGAPASQTPGDKKAASDERRMAKGDRKPRPQGQRTGGPDDPDKSRPRQPRRDRQGAGGGRGRDGKGRRGPTVITAAPKSDGKAAEPDSPFAALLALKETLKQTSDDK